MAYSHPVLEFVFYPFLFALLERIGICKTKEKNRWEQTQLSQENRMNAICVQESGRQKKGAHI